VPTDLPSHPSDDDEEDRDAFSSAASGAIQDAASDADARAFATDVRADPQRIHALAPRLHCGDARAERSAALGCAILAQEAPHLVQAALGRLIRVAHATEDPVIRAALATTLPRLQLGSGEAARLAFVVEAWLEDSPPALQRTAMDAMVALVPQRPALARRIRSVIERRAALGSPTASRHGLALLAKLKEF